LVDLQGFPALKYNNCYGLFTLKIEPFELILRLTIKRIKARPADAIGSGAY